MDDVFKASKDITDTMKQQPVFAENLTLLADRIKTDPRVKRIKGLER